MSDGLVITVKKQVTVDELSEAIVSGLYHHEIFDLITQVLDLLDLPEVAEGFAETWNDYASESE